MGAQSNKQPPSALPPYKSGDPDSQEATSSWNEKLESLHSKPLPKMDVER